MQRNALQSNETDMTISRENFFKPSMISAREKAAVNIHAAKYISALDARLRTEKTDRLRKLREARENVGSTLPCIGSEAGAAVSGN
jgi:hypothetical protein